MQDADPLQSPREPTGNHIQGRAVRHYGRRQLGVVRGKSVGVVHQEMIQVRQHPRGDVAVPSGPKCGGLQRDLRGSRLLIVLARQDEEPAFSRAAWLPRDRRSGRTSSKGCPTIISSIFAGMPAISSARSLRRQRRVVLVAVLNLKVQRATRRIGDACQQHDCPERWLSLRRPTAPRALLRCGRRRPNDSR